MRPSQQSEILEALPGPAWIVDCLLLQVVQCNSAATQLTGDPDFLPLFDKLLDPQLIGRLRSSERQINFQARLDREGSTWVFSACRLDRPAGAAAVLRLVLAQRSALFEVPAQLTFDELLDSSFDGLVILNSGRRIVQVNRSFSEMFGYTVEELRGRTPEVFIPEVRQSEYDHVNEKLDRGSTAQIETQRRHRNGTLIDVQISIQSIYTGRFRGGVVAIYHDLTELNRRVRHRNVRIESTRILAGAVSLDAAMTEILPIICATLDLDVARLWIVGEDGLIPRHCHAKPGCACDDAGKGRSECKLNVIAATSGDPAEVRHFQPIGACAAKHGCRLRDGWQLSLPIFDAQKNVLGVLEVLTSRRLADEEGRREVLENLCASLGQFMTRIRTELELEENEVRFRTLAETVPVGTFIHCDGKIVYANAAAETLCGYSRDEMSTISLWSLFPPEDAPMLRERASRRMEGDELTKGWEARLIRKSGELRWIDYFAALIKLGRRPAILCAGVDTTERRALEVQLRQTQKMEAIGRLAGGVAHDFNNLLTVIGCCSESVLLHPDLNPDVRRAANEINHASDRAAALTRQLLSFSRHQLVAPKLIDLSLVLKSTELILRRTLGEDIVLKMKLDSGIVIFAEPSQIEQIILNLAVNARDAMPDGGELDIRLRRALDEEVDRLEVRPPGYAMLIVADNGCGMSTDVQQHIFEPFFTTKQDSHGTGLGLSTVYGIVKQCGGSIQVTSEPGQGATFQVFFPLATETLPGPEDALTATDEDRCIATILLVEDEEDLRLVLRDTLARGGHYVLEAASGAQALQLSEAHKGSIDLMITDVVMSGMSGRELADRLMPLRPGIKVLYVSGYNEDTVLQKGVIEGQMEFLQKPFRLKALMNKVHQLLTQNPEPL
jgi:PAS domain S-box-containing protein